MVKPSFYYTEELMNYSLIVRACVFGVFGSILSSLLLVLITGEHLVSHEVETRMYFLAIFYITAHGLFEDENKTADQP